MQRAEPLFPIGVWCPRDPDDGSLRAIRTAGFNCVLSGAGGSADFVERAGRAGLRVPADLERIEEIHVDPSATAGDLRLWGWLAILRGARAVAFHAWPDLIDGAGALTPRGRAAGAFAGVVTRNPALFVPLRPVPAAGERVRVDGSGAIEAGFLESRDAVVLVAVNHDGGSHRATLAFAAGTKREFWQDMETGEMVTLVTRGTSPTLTVEFAARDALVLMIRKTSPYDRLQRIALL